MLARRIAMIASVVLLFSGCVPRLVLEMGQRTNVPSGLMQELAGKKMDKFRIFVRDEVTLYDARDLSVVFKRIKRDLNFTQDLPVLLFPSSETAQNARGFLLATKNDFKKNGFMVVAGPCADDCIEVKISFANHRRDDGTLIIMGRYVALYKNREVAVGKDKGWYWREGKSTLLDAIQGLAVDARKLLEHAWNTELNVKMQ